MSAEALALLDRMDGFITSSFTDPTDTVPPTFFLEETDHSLKIVVTPWGNEAERQIMLGMLRRSMLDSGVVRYGVMSEVWVASQSSDPDVNLIEPRHRSDRTEAIALIVVERDGTVLHGQRTIGRADDGSPVLAPLDRDGDAVGSLTTLFQAA